MSDHIKMLTDDVFEGDVGTNFQMTLKDAGVILDVSGATETKFIFSRGPGGTPLVVDVEFVTDGTDGKLDYDTVAGDINNAGVWSWQAKVVSVASTWYSEVVRFRVQETLPES